MARRRPDAIAIVGLATRLTYGQLEGRTRHLARRLAAHTAPASLVAIYGKRDANTVVAMLACLRAGRAFAVLDSSYPAQRLTQLLSELAAPPLLLLDATAEDARIAETIARPGAAFRLRSTDLDSDGDDASAAPIDEARPEAIAYVLFTSGTTGVPKAVQAAHRPLVHFIDWYAARFNAGSGSRFSMLSGIAHDPVLRDVFVPLTVGAQLHIPEPRLLSDPSQLFTWLAESRISHIHGTPQIFGIIGAGRPENVTLRDARYLFSGGDSLRRARAVEMAEMTGGATVVNFYGTTETPQAMGFHVFDPADSQDPVPVGAGIADTQLLVLDEQGVVAPTGITGQVAVRTPYLSAGYLNSAEETRQRFRSNPQATDPDDRLYLTGDRGYFRADDTAVVV
ncbi:MAG: hypothetical protein QOI66_5180, partial [Myxococcales bacterium]|nr:hypothetical protein [Myxococcales bacterium]